MRLRKLILRAVRKRIAEVRRARSRHSRFHNKLQQLLELEGQYRELMSEWLEHRDETTRHDASEVLQKIYRLIRKLSRNNHKRELYTFLKARTIPGWRQALGITRSRIR